MTILNLHLAGPRFIRPSLPLLGVGQLALGALVGPSAVHGAGYERTELSPPPMVREYRAAWIATVGNIDWPSQKGLSTAEQKAELLAIMDRAVQLRLNTLIFQVRPSCDALYASKIEPWSEYLTGVTGKAPEPYYDPLAFAIAEAHKRGLELHAWFNPYRARHNNAKSPAPASHITKTKPQLVREYGGYLWLDPGEKEVQDYSLSVVLDVVRRYDVDGIHFDDYFYPYKVKGPGGSDLDFPDDSSWQRSGARGRLSREDWRRENVNQFIERVYREIKNLKPWVKFGVSPFGIWRPGNPAQIRGYDAYDKLYADSRKWLAEGWLDYFVPQLYWAIKPPEQSFPVLLKWWAEQNKKHRHLLAGMDSTKTSGRWKPEEIVEQIRLTRQFSGVNGHVHWNMKSLLRNSALDSALISQVYGQPALAPPMIWLDRTPPGQPQITARKSGERVSVSWQRTGTKALEWYLLQVRRGREWDSRLLPADRKSIELDGAPEAVAVSAVDRFGNVSAPASVSLGK